MNSNSKSQPSQDVDDESKMPKEIVQKMNFTIREENVKLLAGFIRDLEKRFDAAVTIEETTYVPSEKQNLRWVQLIGKDKELTKCAKAFIEALCSPEIQQELDYPPQLHEDIEAKKDGLEHKHQYKAVVRFQHRGKIVVSGSLEEVLFIISYLEKEIEEWTLRIQEGILMEGPEQLDGHRHPSQMDMDMNHGNMHPDIIAHTTTRRVAPHTATSGSTFNQRLPEGLQTDGIDETPHTATSNLLINQRLPKDSGIGRFPMDSGIGSTFQTGGASSREPFPRLPPDKFGSGSQARSGYGSQLTRSSGINSSQEQRANYQWVERNVPREQPVIKHEPHEYSRPSIKHEPHEYASSIKQQTHISKNVDTNRQRIGSDDRMEVLSADCSVSSNDSSFGARSGSNRQSLEFASNAAHRHGYTDNEVDQALQELPHDFKTSDLIITLNRNRKTTDIHSIDENRQSVDTSPRSRSPFHSPHRKPVSRYQLQSSEPLTSISRDQGDLRHQSHNTQSALMYQSHKKQSVDDKLSTLRKKQQGLLQSLSEHNFPESVGVATGSIATGGMATGRNQPFQDKSHDRDVFVLNDEQDMEIFGEAERMDVDIKQEVEYLRAEFHKGSERPDIVLLPPPVKKEPELVVIDEDDVENTRPQETKFVASPSKNTKRVLAANFQNSMTDNLPRIDKVWSEHPKATAAASMPTVPQNSARPSPPRSWGRLSPQIGETLPQNSARHSSPRSFGRESPRIGDFFTTQGYADLDERYIMDEPDSVSKNSTLQDVAADGYVDEEVEKQLQRDLQQGQLHSARSLSEMEDRRQSHGGLTEMDDLEIEKQIKKEIQDEQRTSASNGDEPLQLSSFTEDYKEPVFEFTSRAERDEQRMDTGEQGGSGFREKDKDGEPDLWCIDKEGDPDLRLGGNENRSHPVLKLRPVPDVQISGQVKGHSGEVEGHTQEVRGHSEERIDEETIEIDDHEYRYELNSSFDSDFHSIRIKKEKDADQSIDEIRIIKEEQVDDVMPPQGQENVQDLIKNFQAEFESKQQDFERKIRERTINETLNMVAEQNEAMQRRLNEKQIQFENEKIVTTEQDMEEKLRIEREKMKEELQKELQKEMQEEMRRQIQLQVDQVKQQMVEQTRASSPNTAGGHAAVEEEKDVIVIKPSQKGTNCPYRPIVIDGSNVAMLHGKRRKRHNTFSCRGIALCVEFFQKMGVEDITVFVPRWRQTQDAVRHDRPIEDKDILDRLEGKGILSFTPSRKIRGRYINSYDDRFIVRLAAESGGIIVSNDNYRDLLDESEQWKNVIETRLLMYTFAGDQFMIPDDPYGRDGPTLKQLLAKPTVTQPKGQVSRPQVAQMNRQQEPGLTTHQIEELTYSIGVEWERLGTYLRFSHSEVQKFRRDYPHNTDGAIGKMLKTWANRHRNKSHHFDMLAEALRLAGRVDLSHLVLRWKVQNGGGGKQTIPTTGGETWPARAATQQGQAAWPANQQGMLGQYPPQFPHQMLRPEQQDWAGPHQQHQAFGGRPQQYQAPATQSRPQHAQYQAPATQSRPPVTHSRPPANQSRPPANQSRPPATQSRPPATQSRAPDIDVRTLPQFKQLLDMFSDKEALIMQLLTDNPKAEVVSLVDKLLS